MNIYEEELKNKSIPEVNADDHNIDTDSYIKVDDEDINPNDSKSIDKNETSDEEIIIPLIEEQVILKETLIKDVDSNRIININNPRVKKKAKAIEYIEDGDYSNKAWSITLVSCILLGFIGFHRFYVGKAGTAILMLLTFGGFGIWILVDLIRIIINNFTDEEGKIVKRNTLAS